MTPDEALAAAWTYCAPGRAKDALFPTGFWPSVARVACEMLAQQTITPVLSFRPTMCTSGNWPEPEQRSSKAKTKADKAANTARLLALLSAKEKKDE